jgi:hypothetical protein
MWRFSMLIDQSVNTQYDFLDIAMINDCKLAKVDEWAGHFLGSFSNVIFIHVCGIAFKFLSAYRYPHISMSTIALIDYFLCFIKMA